MASYDGEYANQLIAAHRRAFHLAPCQPHCRPGLLSVDVAHQLLAPVIAGTRLGRHRPNRNKSNSLDYNAAIW